MGSVPNPMVAKTSPTIMTTFWPLVDFVFLWRLVMYKAAGIEASDDPSEYGSIRIPASRADDPFTALRTANIS